MNEDDQKRISERAYALWQADGGEHGRHEAHWAQAEREIAAEAVPAPVPAPAEGSDELPRRRKGSPKAVKDKLR